LGLSDGGKAMLDGDALAQELASLGGLANLPQVLVEVFFRVDGEVSSGLASGTG
jgi:hypothetical protein